MKIHISIFYIIALFWGGFCNPMILEYNTSLSEGLKITLPLNGVRHIKVDWGDGKIVEINQSGIVNHIYDEEGVYAVSISGYLTHFGFGKLPYDEFKPDSTYPSLEKLVRVIDFGNIGINNLSGAFIHSKNLAQVPAELPSSITNLSSAFYRTGLESIIGLDKWNVENVDTMFSMFIFASKFNQDIGNWNVRNVVDMRATFAYAKAFNQDIGNWNVRNVMNMRSMFRGAELFNQDIGNWNVSRVTDMQGMFGDAESFNQNIGDWDLRNTKTMMEMFKNAKVFNQDISSWNVGKVTNMIRMFDSALSFNQNISSWNISQVKYMDDMFLGVTLSIKNYDLLLQKWRATTPQLNVRFHGGNSEYSSNSEEARQLLTNQFLWDIQDGGRAN